MSKKGSKKNKSRINIKGETTGVLHLSLEKQLKEQMEAPMVRLRYACAIDVMQGKLRMLNADLTEQKNRQVVRSMSARIKSTDSIIKKLLRNGR